MYRVNGIYTSNSLYCQTPLSHLELIRTPTLSSVQLSIACANDVHMLFESVRISVYRSI